MADYTENKEFVFNWSYFALIEFLLSTEAPGAFKPKNAMDIGSGKGVQAALIEAFGIPVDTIDKYSEDAVIQEDFLDHDFGDNKYDFILCSHVIEHQRNQGIFLDKMFDVLSDDGVLLISGPAHSPNALIEGHLNVCHVPLLLQSLIHAGFNCRDGKILSSHEVSFLVKKDPNFELSERQSAGYKWTEKHKARSFVPLQSGLRLQSDSMVMKNVKYIESYTNFKNQVRFKAKPPAGYVWKNITATSTDPVYHIDL